MGNELGFLQDKSAHGFQIMHRRAIAKVAKGVLHFGENGFRLVAKREERFGAAKGLAGTEDLETLVGRHSVCAGLTGVATKDAIAAIVTAEVRQREEDLA